MFEVEIDGQRKVVEFRHEFKKEQNPVTHVITETPVGTTCYLYTGKPGTKFEEMTLEAEVTCKLHIKDRFNRALGRKYSLAKLLSREYSDNKIVRTKFWEAYFSKSPLYKHLSQ